MNCFDRAEVKGNKAYGLFQLFKTNQSLNNIFWGKSVIWIEKHDCCCHRNECYGFSGPYKGGSEWGSPHVGWRLKFCTFVGKSQLAFLSLVGNFFLVLSVVRDIFSSFVASRLTHLRPHIGSLLFLC